MKTKFDEKGVTLIELLIALVISGIIIAAIYRMFVAQTRSYTVQDQVSEVQQNVRNAMERMLKDLRMAGSDDDRKDINGVNQHPPAAITNPAANSITVHYEKDVGIIRHVTYALKLDPITGTNTLFRNQDPPDSPPETVDGDRILENVTQFQLTYGVDADPIAPHTWLNDRRLHWWADAGATVGVNVIAVRVQLSATPASNNPDVNAQVSPRSLDTVVTLRNQLK
jgi:prepilin-type N-terminal cleavage/methylation domain-containing protein